jgi:thioredoxin-related protein
MKQLIFFIFIFNVFVSFESVAQKKAEFNYPEDSVSEESKKAFVKNFNQGKVLYSITCGGCHNFKEKNKQIVPDFSMPQLMDYEMRFQYTAHQDKLNDTHITDEEMSRVILFLRFKNKSGREFPVRNQPASTQPVRGGR